MLNFAQALDELAGLTASGLATPQQLMALADKVSLRIKGVRIKGVSFELDFQERCASEIALQYYPR